MIDTYGSVRVAMNDNPENATGDYACVRLEVGKAGGFQCDGGWVLVGTAYTARCRASGDYVDLVYRFGGVGGAS